MVQQIRSAYHRMARWAGQNSALSRFVGLQVVALEARATPAAAQSLLPPVYPAEAFLVVQFAPPVPSNVTNLAPAIVQAAAAEPEVRTDLFCGGDENTSNQAEFWDEWFASRKDLAEPVASAKEDPPADEAASIREIKVETGEPRIVFVAESASEGSGE